MNIVRYNPNRRITSPLNNGSTLFDDFFDDFLTPAFWTQNKNTLRNSKELKVDIYEKDNHIVIDAELPGVEKDDISVDVKSKLITLTAERKSNEEVTDNNYYRKETRYGTFKRSFNLPFEIETDNVEANFKNGILRLTITRPEKQLPKKIAIN
ncbi:Hsp20/alpha crystallin family protein [Desulforhopalus singaporensis]|uniref:HSP20 family protein n=1 Tax=Desulforhopalus singaporensis TaxID=91360 RepID=A0A1H0UGX6_9BACT|nr:Hsp20/alpha crystallin family protein [Desulforhopalus singaporensis]SDP65248.1 HSP20 family protein [Desulforhopalus singaporensis]